MHLHVSFVVGVSFPVTHAEGLNMKLGLPDSFLLDGLGCSIHIKCVEGLETKTLLQCGLRKAQRCAAHTSLQKRAYCVQRHCPSF